jgi:hypothetical protein
MKSAMLPGYPSYGIHATHTVCYRLILKITPIITLGYDQVQGRTM